MISDDGERVLESITSKLERVCSDANIDQTTMEQLGVINSMRTAMIAKKSQSTYEKSLSAYEKDVEIAVAKLYELVQKKTSIRKCLISL